MGTQRKTIKRKVKKKNTTQPKKEAVSKELPDELLGVATDIPAQVVAEASESKMPEEETLDTTAPQNTPENDDDDDEDYEPRTLSETWEDFKDFCKNNILKIFAIAVAFIGVPIGVWLSFGVQSRWMDNTFVHVRPPDEMHMHVAIGVWLIFILSALFIWRVADLMKIENEEDLYKVVKSKIASIIIWLTGFFAGLLVGHRSGAMRPWNPELRDIRVVVPTATEWVIVQFVWLLMLVLGLVLWIWANRVYKNHTIVHTKKKKRKLNTD